MTAPGDALDRGFISLQQGHTEDDYEITVGPWFVVASRTRQQPMKASGSVT
jgi:hypothetical protein